MSKHSKAYRAAAAKIDRDTLYSPVQALSLAKEPQANVERYDALRQVREVRHAS